MARFNIFRSNRSNESVSDDARSTSSSATSNGSAISPNTPRDNTTWKQTQTIRFGAEGFTRFNAERYHKYQGYFSEKNEVAKDSYYRRGNY